jgi:hypothetical protein
MGMRLAELADEAAKWQQCDSVLACGCMVKARERKAGFARPGWVCWVGAMMSRWHWPEAVMCHCCTLFFSQWRSAAKYVCEAAAHLTVAISCEVRL